METAKKSNKKRMIILLVLLATLILLPVSGMASDNEVMKHIHVFIGIVFVIAGIFHIIDNWKLLKFTFMGK